MKKCRLNLKDLFTGRIIYMAEPGEHVIQLRVVKRLVRYKGHRGTNHSYVVLENVETGTRIELGAGWFKPNEVLLRFFAKYKQAERYSHYPRVWKEWLPTLIQNMEE